MKIQELYQKYAASYKVSTDTRTIEKNSIFFALKGESHNGNQYAAKALKEGASYVVVDEKEYYKNDERYILVDDSLKTLQELANYHRKQLNIPILAITGSNGKTTTKELIAKVLSKKYKVVATEGNLNNHIGVPLSLLKMTPNTEFGIIEMGANHFGEIDFLCEIAQPNFGYITNFGKAHLEGFGSIKGVIKAKTELYRYLKRNKGIAFVNAADSVQFTKSAHQKRQLIGRNCFAKPSSDFVQLEFDNLEVKTQLTGDYNYKNLVAAIGIGQYFKVSNVMIKEALESYLPNNKRSQWVKRNMYDILLDAYNANPTSMEAALRSFDALPFSDKVVILGDMFELGDDSDKEHQYIADLATKLNFSKVILVGAHFFKTESSKAIKFASTEELLAVIDPKDYLHTHILLKASRGMALERLLDKLP